MILVIGATGQVGSALMRLARDVVAVDRTQLDLSDVGRDSLLELVASIRPSHVVNCAAYTAVDKAESEPEIANAINGRAVGLLAEVCASLRTPFVTYSSDYVFSGDSDRPYRESDPVAPINAYGSSKLLGERLALEYGGSLVIRTSWVVSGTPRNFVATMLRMADEREELRVVSDQIGRPTIADDLAKATLQCLDIGLDGLLHLANEGVTTWFDLALRALDIAGLDTDVISPCATAEYPTPALRPRYSVLDTDRAMRSGIRLPVWDESLPKVVSQLRSAVE